MKEVYLVIYDNHHDEYSVDAVFSDYESANAFVDIMNNQDIYKQHYYHVESKQLDPPLPAYKPIVIESKGPFYDPAMIILVDSLKME